MSALKKLFVIAERKKIEKLIAAIKEEGGTTDTTLLAEGTARSEILSVLGLDSSEKALISATVKNGDVARIEKRLVEDFKFGSGGGVAFTVPISAVSGPIAALLLAGEEL